jgi:protein-arginine kinase activator protein McsA
MSNNCPLTGKPCSKHRGYTVSETKGEESKSYAVCEDCMHLRKDLWIGDEHLDCPRCGMTLDSIIRSSRLGCPTCYDHFSEPLAFIIPSVQLSEEKHKGGEPHSFKRVRAESLSPARFASDLLSLIKKASSAGRYEEARALLETLSRVREIIARSDESGVLSPRDRAEITEVIYRHMYPESAEGL